MRSIFAVAALSLSTLVHANPIQVPNLKVPAAAAENKKAVVSLFRDAFGKYSQFFGHDDFAPVSDSFLDDRNGWGASIVDASTTAIIMGLDDLVPSLLNFSTHIDFSVSQTNDTVEYFETVIRYLAGLLSAYELTDQTNQGLLDKAIELGNKLAFAWQDNNAMPFNFLNFTTNTPIVDTTGIADVGTNTLEFFKLSFYSHNDTFRKLAEGSVKHVIGLAAPLPGLPAQIVDPSTGQFDDAYITWGGGSDSYFEYLIKYARLTNNADETFARAWKTAVDSSIKTLIKESTVGGHTYLADQDDEGLIRHIFSHLGCFAAGNWIMGGKLLNNDTILNIGLKLNDACFNTYTSTTSGIGPEVFAFMSADGNNTDGGDPTADDLAFYNQHGFWIFPGDNFYDLRPEVLESNFYAWRATGNVTYLARAEAAFNSISSFCKVPQTGGFGGMVDVMTIGAGWFDETESFFFAEVFKYLFLTFDDPSHISLDEWVFNTEAHPLRAPALLPSYDVPGFLPPNPGFMASAVSKNAKLPLVSANPKIGVPGLQSVYQGS